MIFGAIGHNFKSELIFWEGNVNKLNYFKTLDEHNVFRDANAHFGEKKWLFQQDNARPHIATDTINALKSAGIQLLEDWPPYSPDLNIVEVVWAIMKRRIDKEASATIVTLDMLKEIIQNVWEGLSYETINKLVASINKRMLKVVEKNGETIFLNELD